MPVAGTTISAEQKEKLFKDSGTLDVPGGREEQETSHLACYKYVDLSDYDT